MNNPIRRINSREVYRGKLVHLREDQVILPRGTQTIFEYVEIKNGATVLAIEDNSDVWLIREWKYAIDRPSIEAVSGGIEPGEDPLETARRELQEEAGLTAAEFIPLGFVDPFTTMLACPNYLFLARGLTPVPREPEEGEVMEVLRFPFDEALRMALEGTVTHAASSVLILKAAHWLARQGQG